MNRVKTWLWGIILIAVGVILGLYALDIITVNIFFPGWWTLIIIVPCVVDLFSKNSDKVGDLIGIMIGVCLMLACLEVIDFGMIWKLVLPVALILIGLSVIFKDALKGKMLKAAKIEEGKTGEKSYRALFGEQKISFDGEEFKGCECAALFGDVKCDLRKAKIERDVVVKAKAMFGGVTIIVPTNVKVEVMATSVFGGAEDLRKDQNDEAKHTIFIDAACIFGEVDIK